MNSTKAMQSGALFVSAYAFLDGVTYTKVYVAERRSEALAIC